MASAINSPRTNMIHSLRFRLLLTLIVVVVVAVGAVAVFASWRATSELQRFVERDRIMSALFQKYNEGQDLPTVQALAEQIEQTYGDRVILTDTAGRVIVDSERKQIGQLVEPPPQLAPALPGQLLTIQRQAVQVGDDPNADVFQLRVPRTDGVSTFSAAPVAIYFGAAGQQGVVANESLFTGAVNQSLLLAVGAAGLVALLLTLLLSRRILGPIEALTAAARALEKGDLSRRVQVGTKDEIGALAHAFNAMADGLARQEQLRRNMVTDVAHELCTPLTNIRGYLEALRDGVAQPHPALLGSLHDEALLLNRLIDDLQDLALAEAGQLKLAPRPVALAAVVEQTIGALQAAAADKQLTLNIMLPAELPDVEADPARIGQVLRNLVNNAITHTPPGGRVIIEAEYMADYRLQIANCRLPQSAICDLQSAILVPMRDTAGGIAPEHLPNIF